MRLGRRSGLTPLDEAAAYARCHGMRDNDVRIVKLPPRRPRYEDVLDDRRGAARAVRAAAGRTRRREPVGPRESGLRRARFASPPQAISRGLRAAAGEGSRAPVRDRGRERARRYATISASFQSIVEPLSLRHHLGPGWDVRVGEAICRSSGRRRRRLQRQSSGSKYGDRLGRTARSHARRDSVGAVCGVAGQSVTPRGERDRTSADPICLAEDSGRVVRGAAERFRCRLASEPAIAYAITAVSPSRRSRRSSSDTDRGSRWRRDRVTVETDPADRASGTGHGSSRAAAASASVWVRSPCERYGITVGCCDLSALANATASPSGPPSDSPCRTKTSVRYGSWIACAAAASACFLRQDPVREVRDHLHALSCR